VLGFESLFCALGSPETTELEGSDRGEIGTDRYSRLVSLIYGRQGFAFDEPGEYRVRCFYSDTEGFVTPSNILRIRIARPASREEDRLAQDFYAHPTGLVLALGDHRSPFLRAGADAVSEVMARRKGTAAAATLGHLLASAVARPFHRVARAEGARTAALEVSSREDVRQAVQLTEDALKIARADVAKAGNLAYRAVVELRAACLRKDGNARQATRELSTLRTDLAARGVHPAVLKTIGQSDGRR
jgi:hypothetical protein